MSEAKVNSCDNRALQSSSTDLKTSGPFGITQDKTESNQWQNTFKFAFEDRLTMEESPQIDDDQNSSCQNGDLISNLFTSEMKFENYQQTLSERLETSITEHNFLCTENKTISP